MKVTNEKTENRQAFLIIEMEPHEMEEAIEESYHHLAQRTRIPGFRKGKAPRDVLERYVGREGLLEEAIDHMIPETYQKAIDEQSIVAIAQPEIEITQTEPLIFKAIVPLVPEVKMGDYHAIRVSVDPAQVTDDNLDAVIEQLRHQNATWEPVERPAEFKDLVTFDIESTIEDKPFINQKGVQYQLIEGTPMPAPGFAEQLVGVNRGETREFEIQFADDDPRKDVAGKKASYKVQVAEIKQEVLPELNDDFALMVNPEFDSLAKLREAVSAEMKQRAEDRTRAELEGKVLDAAVAVAGVEFPPVMVEAEISRILSQQLQAGNQNLDDYLARLNKTEVELREEFRPLASQRVTRSLVLSKVAEEEKIEVSGSEIDAEIKLMGQNAENKSALDQAKSNQQVRETLERIIRTRKTVQYLVDIAGGESGKKDVSDKEEK